MWLNSIAPKNFFCRYPLSTGAIFFGIFMTCVMVACAIGILIDIIKTSSCSSCTYSARSFSITAVLYCVFMIFVNIWFIWGVKKKKTAVVLSWVVITAMWVMLANCLLTVLLCMYARQTMILTLLILGILALDISLYGILVGYGYCLELKSQLLEAQTSNTI